VFVTFTLTVLHVPTFSFSGFFALLIEKAPGAGAGGGGSGEVLTGGGSGLVVRPKTTTSCPGPSPPNDSVPTSAQLNGAFAASGVVAASVIVVPLAVFDAGAKFSGGPPPPSSCVMRAEYAWAVGRPGGPSVIRRLNERISYTG
jgi:hypothetical protein